MRATATLTRADRARLEQATNWMVRLQADDLGEDQLAEWLAWYEDPANRIAFDEMQAVQEDLRAIGTSERDAFARGLMSTATEGPPARWRRWVPAMAGAALLAFGIASWFPAGPGTENVSAAYRTARADHREVRLPDGSAVKLGGQSSLSLNFTRDGRYLVLERGEALFMVASDRSKPFVVQAGRVRVTAIGTQFNVRRADDTTFVAIKEGVVEVSREPSGPGSGAATPNETMRVAAGRQIVSGGADVPIIVVSIAPERIATWQEGRLEFVDEPLRTVIATVNRYSPREIVLTDSAASGDLRFNGIVMEGRVADWIAAIQEVFPLRADTSGSGAILLSPAKR